MIQKTSGQRGNGGESPAGRSLSQMDFGLSAEDAFVFMSVTLVVTGCRSDQRQVTSAFGVLHLPYILSEPQAEARGSGHTVAGSESPLRGRARRWRSGF